MGAGLAIVASKDGSVADTCQDVLSIWGFSLDKEDFAKCK